MTDATAHPHDHPSPGSPDHVSEAAAWDERYSEADRVWSGDPNGALVVEVESETPGSVLDVGCGEGADAVWLALRGWDVTALDVSGVALARARQAAADAGAEVRWLHSGLLEAALPEGGFDLVSAQYPALARTPDGDAERALLAAVAPGGTLLFVHHAMFGSQPSPTETGAHSHGGAHHDTAAHSHDHGEAAEDDHEHSGVRFNPEDYVGPADIVALLGDGWQIETHELRDRDLQSGAGAHHTEDIVVLARRLA